MPNEVDYIDTAQGLQQLCKQLESAPWIAVDTEFLREKTYYPLLCLIQVASADCCACVDPIAVADLSPLLDLLYNPAMTKVMHACRQDMEIFYHIRGTLPGPIFDTQVAAPLLGYADQVGYATLVEKILGVTLSKAHTRTDWSRRPLSAEQLQYAADDVRYLRQIYQVMRDQLEKKGRLTWLHDDFVKLTDTALYSNPPEQAWRRCRGGDRLRGPGLAILQALAAWRETTARDENRPRNWLMKDDVLIDISRQMPQDSEQLSHVRGMPDKVFRRHGKQLLAIVAQAKQQQPEKALASPVKPPRPSAEQEAVVDLLMAVVRATAAQQSMSASALTTRKELERLVMGERDLNILKGWQGAMVGKLILSVLEEGRAVKVVGGRINIE